MNECEFPKKANLGCGYDVRPGYLNIDLHVWHNPDLVADVTKLDMLPSGYFEEVVAQDVLEHLERHKVGPALAEWARILAGGGALYVRVPSLMGMFNMLKQPENWPCEEAEKIVHLMYGTQAYTGDYHLSGFTAPMLNTYLNRAGLRVVQANIMDGWLIDIKAKKTDNMTDLEFVHEAYFRLFGRPASEHEVEYHDCLLSSGKSSRADLECALVIGRNEMFQKMRQGNEVEYDQAGIDAIRNSTSWKITAPLRSFVSMLRKLGN